MTPDEIKIVLERHRAWLLGELAGVQANLSGADLSDADLSDANLSDADLSDANLSRANLSRANLSDANLSRANLSHANLSGADLRRADLRRADLSHTNLSRADLSHTNLSRANLSQANLSHADLSDANLSDANLSDANLSDADLSDADLRRANLSQADLRGVVVPVVPDLDVKLHAAVCGTSAPGRLDMSSWHTCETTHCRAGWAIHLAGEAGAALEEAIGPCAAGALIYHASTGRVPNFYASNEEALADICERAEEGKSK